EIALSLYEAAVRLDPHFIMAHAQIANICVAKYRAYERSAMLIERTEEAAETIRKCEGETALYCCVMSSICLCRGDVEGALTYAQQSIQIDPEFPPGYSTLAFAYGALGRREEKVKALEVNIRLRENSLAGHTNLIMGINGLGDMVRVQSAVAKAKPVFDRYIRLNPDDYDTRASIALIHSYSGNFALALTTADELSRIDSIDAVALYNLACLYLKCNVPIRGIEHLRRAVVKGFRGIEAFHNDPDLESLRGTVEFEELMKELEAGNV
ncbi:MAG: hypothetical protein ABI778_10930, partial [Ignavibacteriota bacterium]